MTSETIAQETIAQDIGLDDLLNRHFPGKVVRKDLTKLVKEGANVPVYVLEYLLGNYCASNDEVLIEEGLRTVKKFEKLLVGGIWCLVTLTYFFEENQKGSPFLLQDLKPIQMPNMDLEELFQGRRAFTEQQWIDALLRS